MQRPNILKRKKIHLIWLPVGQWARWIFANHLIHWDYPKLTFLGEKKIRHQRRWISFTQVCCWDHQLSSSIMAGCPSWLYIFSPSINGFAKRATRPQSYCDLPWGDQPSILISNLWKNRLVKVLCLCITTWQVGNFLPLFFFCIVLYNLLRLRVLTIGSGFGWHLMVMKAPHFASLIMLVWCCLPRRHACYRLVLPLGRLVTHFCKAYVRT